MALLVSTADGQGVDDRVAMTRARRCRPLSLRIAAGQRRFQQDTFYRITAGDATTPKYKLEVQIAPTIIVDRIDYHFPPYTGQPDRTIEKQGDIKALEGTQVTIHATANMDIREATIDLGEGLQDAFHDEHRDEGHRAVHAGLDPDANNPGKAQYDHYQILFTGVNGHRRPPAVRNTTSTSIRDLPPDVEIVEPQQQEVDVAEDGQLPIGVTPSIPTSPCGT